MSTATPLKRALITGLAVAHTFIYQLLSYLKLQTRIATATDGFLDLISYDYFGLTLPRGAGQSDTSFRNNILANLIRERGTRNAVMLILQQITGRAPVIFEPTRPLDTGVYGGPYLGYGVAGGYGSLSLPFQTFITAYRPIGTGIAFVAGYGSPSGGYGAPSRAEWASINSVNSATTDADIYAAINSVRPAGYILWARILS